jgi:hypothetical protein
MNIHHIGVQPRKVEHIFCESSQGRLQRHHLPECPVVCGRFVPRICPVSQQGPWNHRGLNLLEDFSQYLNQGVLMNIRPDRV